jgi:NADPH:quinone reductase-like Zn-dependent oxidoreductase
MASIRAARIHSFGGPEVLQIDTIELLPPAPGQVLVKVTAAGVNPVDWKLREGYLRDVVPIQFPYTLGCDVSGTIEAVGAGVAHLSPGEKVFGYPNLSHSGAFADALVMAAHELAPAPTNIPLKEAAAIPVAAITAAEGLFVHGQLQAGQRVLILGGAGGIGSAAIQLARFRGAQVYATASTRNQNFLRQLGATPIDYSHQATVDVAAGVDLILDTVGAETGAPALASLRPGGRYVTCVYQLPPAELLEANQISAAMYGIQPSGERLAEIATIVESGGLRMPIEREFPLTETVAALNASQSGRTRGKLLIVP